MEEEKGNGGGEGKREREGEKGIEVGILGFQKQ